MAHRHPTALIIDDDADTRTGVAALLQIEGYEVVTAEHGRDAFRQLYAGARPCIIVLDLMMPQMTGFEFRQQQRLHADFKDIPVIVQTSISDAESIAGHLDARAYVQKPAMPAQLVALVRNHCLK